MKRLSLLVVAMLLATASFAQVKKSPAPERAGWDLNVGLYGDVRAVIVTENKFEEYFGEYKPIVTSECRYIFHESGNVAKKQIKFQYNEYSHSLEYEYDSAGRKISMSNFDGLGESGNLTHKIIYKYDSIGNVVEKIRYNANGKAEERYYYKYDVANNLVEESKYNSIGRCCYNHYYTYEYDSAGRVVKIIRGGTGYDIEISLTPASSRKAEENIINFALGESSQTYQYDSEGNLVEEIEYDLGSLWKKYTYEYDAAGNVVGENRYDSFNSLVEKTTFKYDSAGNNFEKIVYDQYGEVDVKVVVMYDANGNVLEVIEYSSMYDGNAFVPKRAAKLEIFYDNHEEVEFTFKDFTEEDIIAENVEVKEHIVEEQIFVKVERMPSFMGGDLNTFRQWFGTEFKYPQEAMENGIQGIVVVKFVIEIDGSLSNVEFLQSPDPIFNDEVERVLMSSPKWRPGYQGDEPVRVRYVLPIKLNLN
ncbi:MAG: TonB family protein [Tidjanibacter sp.]|nr:TonB family protein [Tidjanibacter sp.]